jgi:glucoamylase
LFYRGALDILTTKAVPSADVLAEWQNAFSSSSALPTDAASLAKVFAAQGDGVMARLRTHVVAEGFHLDEQLDRNTGKQLSAKDLTWSYAEVLNAMHHRSQYLAKA